MKITWNLKLETWNFAPNRSLTAAVYCIQSYEVGVKRVSSWKLKVSSTRNCITVTLWLIWVFFRFV